MTASIPFTLRPAISPPPLALYIHMPWCVAKCPYCDFNSHALRAELPEDDYVARLLIDLEHELPEVWQRSVVSVFIGGGTPSLFSPEAIDRLLSGVRARLPLLPGAEITLEANPGTVERGRFEEFRHAGITRLSIGVQSFNDDHLRALGRIHGAREALAAAGCAHRAGFESFNLDLMFGLPGQNLAAALADVEQALALAPPHLSHYQLTLEPNTAFAHRPPVLPADDDIAAMQAACHERLATAGFEHYEVSAFARAGHRCAHNLNYWQFGDYLGIGAGAHGKLTLPDGPRIERRWKLRHPREYQRHAGTAAMYGGRDTIAPTELPFEFMLNALRLTEGVPAGLFELRTGLSRAAIAAARTEAVARGLLDPDPNRLLATALGQRFLNDLLVLFLPAETTAP